jgi:hypothetical protein
VHLPVSSDSATAEAQYPALCVVMFICCVHLEGSAPLSQLFKNFIHLVLLFFIFHMMYNHVLAVFVTIPSFQV